MNIENLRKLQQLLNTIPQDKFDMSDYRQYAFGERMSNDDPEFAKPQRNSVGCAIGHSTILDPEGFMWYVENTSYPLDSVYIKWSLKYFGLNDKNWDWLFMSRWKEIDNTPQGVIDRIDYLIVNKLSLFDLNLFWPSETNYIEVYKKEMSEFLKSQNKLI